MSNSLHGIINSGKIKVRISVGAKKLHNDFLEDKF